MHEPILDFKYDDEWHPITDAVGFSLVHIDPDAAPESWNSRSYWRPSALPRAFPGAEDPHPARFPQVVVNEVWPHAQTVELLNTSVEQADISGWFLTDDFRDPKKFRIPNDTLLPPGGFVVFDGATLGFSLSASGEEVYLFSADEDTLTGYAHGFDFGAIETDRSFGRYVTLVGGEQFPAQSAATVGATNAGPRAGPVIITEIHYRPPDLIFGAAVYDNDQDEFIELFNPGLQAVPLYSISNPENTWRVTDAVTFSFPSGASIPGRGIALVVGFDPANPDRAERFRTHFSVAPEVTIFGPFDGKLDNSSDRVELRRPIPSDPAVPSDPIVYSLIERVTYSDEAPWPAAADGLGRSLHRVRPDGYANDAANWVAQNPSPGVVAEGRVPDPPLILAHPASATNLVGSTVTFTVNAESVSTLQYQWRHNSRAISGATNSMLRLENVTVGAEADYEVVVLNAWSSATSQKAKLTLIEEPRIDSVEKGSALIPGFAGAMMRFEATRNQTYTVQYTDDLSNDWHPLIHVFERSTDRRETIFDDARATNRFYRLANPAIR